MMSAIWLFIGAIMLLIVGVCIKVAIWKSDRLLQRRIDNLGKRYEEKD